jgi:putative oxygen-independent coproporphyrinogen III oxidase
VTASSVDAHAGRPAVYVHLPFCTKVCPYCDFAVVAGRDDLIERYVAAVVAEIELSPRWKPLHAIFMGGGTPSHVPTELLGRILDALGSRHGLAPQAEVTLEANPEDFEPELGADLVGLGFTRVSFGAQSFDDRVLGELGRRHRAVDIEKSMTTARSAGFASVSLDLIFGSAAESDRSWETTLSRAVALGPDHVSCYALTVEPGTPLHRQVAGGASAPDPDVQADRYEMAEAALSGSSYQHYEVSNWARTGHECRYNMTVWAQGQYEAYGNGAHRFREGSRSHNIRRVDAYIERVESGIRPISGVEELDGWDRELDRLFVGLRRSAGVSRGPGTDALVESYEGKLLVEQGVISVGPDRVEVIRPLLTDEVLRTVLGLEPLIGSRGVTDDR